MKSLLSILLILCFLPNCISVHAQSADTTGFPPQAAASSLPPGTYAEMLESALVLQLKADSAARIARDKRIAAQENPDEEMRRQLVSEIIRAEKESKKLQREADVLFEQARLLKPVAETGRILADPYVEPANEVEGILVYRYKNDAIPASPESPPAEGSLMVETSREMGKDTQNSRSDAFERKGVPAYSQEHPIPMGLAVYPGLVYRIQVGAFSKPAANESFGGLSPMCFEITPAGIYKYYAGVLYSSGAVSSALEKVREAGYPDAFIVAFLDGRPIATDKARDIELGR